ncbi:MAG: hypothetical protein KC964_20920, partial [Candidatus Omnitrophica bacterium]|nr:hypothetical protein [Candidatus Omnitrophota bacterium]
MRSHNLIFPSLSDRYGLAPEDPRVVPVRAYLNGEIVEAIRFPFPFKGELVLDFGRKLTGKTYVQADGDLDFTYGSDWE